MDSSGADVLGRGGRAGEDAFLSILRGVLAVKFSLVSFRTTYCCSSKVRKLLRIALRS
jgi:hypothetical protein